MHFSDLAARSRQVTLHCGAGGNRTPVHQAMSARATTIPDFETDAISPTGRPTTIAGETGHDFPCGESLDVQHWPVMGSVLVFGRADDQWS